MSTSLPALAVRPPQPVASPLEQYGQVLSLRDMIQRGKMQEQNLQSGNLELQQKQQALADQKAMTDAMHEWDGKDYNNLPPLVLKHGASANAVMGLKGHIVDQQKKLADLGKDQLANEKVKNDYFAQAVANVKALPPEQQPDAFEAAKKDAIGRGWLDPQQAQGMQYQGPQMLDILEKSLLGHSGAIDAAAKQATTAHANAQASEITAKMPGVTADAEQKVRDNYASQLASAFRTSPQAYAQALGELPHKTAVQFPQQPQSEDDILKPGMTAHQQATLAASKTLQGAWLASFRKENGRDPNSAEILQHQKETANAVHITNTPANETDIDAVARTLVDPRNLTALKDVVSMRNSERIKVFAAAKKLDPTFDPGLTNQRIRFLQGYEDPKGRAALNRQAINNIMQHAGDLSDVNQQYRNSNVKIVNTPLNLIAEQLGYGNNAKAYADYQSTIGVLKDELGLYFAGGYAPSKEQQQTWNDIISDKSTPAKVEAFAKEVVRLGLRRANTFNSQFKSMMGYDDPNMIIPEAKNAAERLGLGKEVENYGSGGQIGGAGSGNAQPAAAKDKKGRRPIGSFEKQP